MANERLGCPIDGCRMKRTKDHSFCASCWFQLPQEMRDAIFRSRRPNEVEAHRLAVANARKFLNDAITARVPSEA